MAEVMLENVTKVFPPDVTAVAKKDLSERAGDKRLCHNHFLVDITSFRIEGSFAYVKYTRTYNIQLD